MQTTQGQHPQCTLPVVQPYLAPHLDIREGYKSKSVRCLAIAQIVLGCFAFCFQVWAIINMTEMSVIGTGIWAGLIFIVTGCVGWYSAEKKTYCSIVIYMVVSSSSSLLALSVLVITSLDLTFASNCNYYNWNCEDYTTVTIFIDAMFIIISVAEGTIGIVTASLAAFQVCCSSRNQRVLSYTNPGYVQGPNGQLLLVTGQQPSMVITMSGQQVPVTANQGGYQTLGLPGSYQAPSVPAQVGTMTTQPPMPQLESVPPPTYQTLAENAESNQQPHVHQTAGEEKN